MVTAMGGESGDARRQGLDMIDQAHADAAVAWKYSGGSEKQSAGGDRQATPVQKKEQDKRSTSSPKEGKDGKPLRYFNNGIEVDMEGNPFLGQEPPAAATTTSNGKPSPVINNLASLDNNIIAKFLTVVVSRVPEIAPTVADLLPDVGDPMLFKRKFPNVVDATLAKLRSIQERFTNLANANIDLHRRVTNYIAAIEPYKVNLSTASGMVPLPHDDIYDMYRTRRRAHRERAIRHAGRTGRCIGRRCSRRSGHIIGRRTGRRAAACCAARSLFVICR